jgi:outer membrane protein TolC
MIFLRKWVRIPGIGLLVLMSIISLNPIHGQDDVNPLSYRQFLNMVKEHHPVAYQANLYPDFAAANSLQAKGGFDPKLEAGYEQKSFDGKNYYKILGSGMKIPTWFGIEIKAGYDYTQGEFLNSSDFLPNQGLWNAGLSIPVGRGLILDERRAELKKAEIFRQSADLDQILLLNDLVYDASEAYFNWQEKAQLFNIAEEGVQLARQRLVGTISSYNNGDKPGIDTLESYLSLQARLQDLQVAEQDYRNAKTGLQRYLWIEGSIPVEMEENTIPEPLDSLALKTILDSLQLQQARIIETHPLLISYALKIDQLNVDLRLSKEDLKPDLRLDYHPVTASGNDFLRATNLGNYKFGATFFYPLLQRKSRGKIQQNELKIKDVEFDLIQKERDLEIKLEVYKQNFRNQEEQWRLLSQMVGNYQRMLAAENRKFSVGESSVFLVNTRESNYLAGRRKQIEILLKLLKSRLGYIYTGAQALNI